MSKVLQKAKQLEDTINNSKTNSEDIFELSKEIDELIIETLNKKLESE